MQPLHWFLVTLVTVAAVGAPCSSCIPSLADSYLTPLETPDDYVDVSMQAASTMFSFEKGELEGKNVSCLMPQPFSSRHNSYLQRYVTSSEPHSSGVKRKLVAMDKVCGSHP